MEVSGNLTREPGCKAEVSMLRSPNEHIKLHVVDDK